MGKRVIVLTLVLFAAMQLFQYWVLPGAEPEKELLDLFRNTPEHIFYLVFIGFTAFMLGFAVYVILGHKHWAQRVTMRYAQQAQNVATSLWRVDGDPFRNGEWIVMKFAHVWWESKTFVLTIRPEHPDIKQFHRLNSGEVVEFEPLSESMECALDFELCGYLRIKSVEPSP